MNYKKKHYQIKSIAEIPVIVIGIICYIGVVMLGTVITSYMLGSEMIPVSAADITACAIQAVAALGATILAVLITQHKKSIVVACVTVCALLLPIMTTILFFDSAFHKIGIKLLITMIAAAPAFSLSVYRKQPKFGHRKYKIH